MGEPIQPGDGERLSRRAKLRALKKGPGVFVYAVPQFAVESEPTLLRERVRIPKEVKGRVVTDALGRIVYEYVYGDPILNHKKKAQMGGPPIYTRVELDKLTIWGVEFPRGVAVAVEDAKLAQKLRGHGAFEEVEGDAESEAAPKKRKRKAEQPESEEQPTNE